MFTLPLKKLFIMHIIIIFSPLFFSSSCWEHSFFPQLDFCYSFHFSFTFLKFFQELPFCHSPPHCFPDFYFKPVSHFLFYSPPFMSCTVILLSDPTFLRLFFIINLNQSECRIPIIHLQSVMVRQMAKEWVKQVLYLQT